MHIMIAEIMLFFNILNPSKSDFPRRHPAFADMLSLNGTDFYCTNCSPLLLFSPYSLSRFVLFPFFLLFSSCSGSFFPAGSLVLATGTLVLICLTLVRSGIKKAPRVTGGLKAAKTLDTLLALSPELAK